MTYLLIHFESKKKLSVMQKEKSKRDQFFIICYKLIHMTLNRVSINEEQCIYSFVYIVKDITCVPGLIGLRDIPFEGWKISL